MATINYHQLTEIELSKRRHALVLEMGRIEEELNLRRKKDRHHIRAEDIKWKKVEEITDSGVTVTDGQGNRSILQMDIAVLALGVESVNHGFHFDRTY
jgi:hypothetical protein